MFRRLRFPRFLRAIIVALFIVQNALAPVQALAASTPPPAFPVAQEEEPPIDAEELPPVEPAPGLFGDEEIAPPPIHVSDALPPLAPAIVRIEGAQSLLLPGDTAQVTVRVWQHDDWETELTLRVNLPDQLLLEEEGPLSWTLPQNVQEGPAIVQTLNVVWQGAPIDTTGALIQVLAVVEAEGYAPVKDVVQLADLPLDLETPLDAAAATQETTSAAQQSSGIDAPEPVLPSVSHLTSDLQTGGSTINYPIDVPQGLGGMAPNLNLGYSSVSVDDLRDANGMDDINDTGSYKAQAGLAGLGWHIGGMSYIALSDRGEPTVFEDDEFQLVLNGKSSKMQITGLDNDSIYGTAGTYGVASPWTFSKVEYYLSDKQKNGRTVKRAGEWVVTTSDGTKHYFGSPTHPLDGQGQLGTFQHQQLLLAGDGSGFSYWLPTKWYLRQSVDPLGNKIEYHYDAEIAGVESNCSAPPPISTDATTYHSAVRPVEIRWSYTGINPPGDLSGPRDRQTYKMRVQFGYEERGESDWQVKDYEDDDCVQAMFSKERLQDIRVEVRKADNSDWHTLRRYHLDYDLNSPECNDYPSNFNVDSIHSELASITHHGEDDGVLNRQCFFHLRKNGARHGQVYIGRVYNGWGAHVDYGYSKVPLRWCAVSDEYEIDDPTNNNDPINGEECPYSNSDPNVADNIEHERRWYVSTMATYNDGLGGGRSVVRFDYEGRAALQMTRDSVDYYTVIDIMSR